MKKSRVLVLVLVMALLAFVSASPLALAEARPTVDRAGKAIAVPEAIERIVSLAPATTQIIESLGLLDKVVAVDTQTPLYVDGVSQLPQFDLMTPDGERLAALLPDVAFVSGMSFVGGDNPFKVLEELGVCVIEIPTSDSIEGVRGDIRFVADCLGAHDAGEALVQEMDAAIEEVAAIGRTIESPKTVLFEVSALPYIYSFGRGTFLSEMIDLIGAKNVFDDQESWLAVTEEAAVHANPDVIMTSVNYLPDPVAEIMGRAGWDQVTAVANGDVYYIDNASSSLPNHHIVRALVEMARAVEPEAYASLEIDRP